MNCVLVGPQSIESGDATLADIPALPPAMTTRRHLPKQCHQPPAAMGVVQGLEPRRRRPTWRACWAHRASGRRRRVQPSTAVEFLRTGTRVARSAPTRGLDHGGRASRG
jgi:hypothetical protein